MTYEEAKAAIEDLKAQGETEDDILKVLYGMYTEDKLSLSDLRTFIGIMGYEFTDEFEAMSEEDKKTKGWEQETDENDSASGENSLSTADTKSAKNVAPSKNDSWASIWDFANGIEWITADVDMQSNDASKTFNLYAKAYKKANELFFGNDKDAFAKCLQEVKTLREQFSKSDWERLIDCTKDGRARYEYRRMMNAKFPTGQA